MRIVVTLLVLLLWAADASAFCGFYVAGAGAKLYNNATLVVLMRDGKRTVLSMQNNYQGPPESFAMVVPVPVVLQKENVKTLDPKIFERVDRLSAPRLVEYWERDPCFVPDPPPEPDMAAPPAASAQAAAPPRVKVEAQFEVGEYDVVVLSSNDSGALDTWLRDNEYKIPEGAEPLLKPYVESGSKFFVAKVDVTKVKMKDGMAMLSPLRFHYESDAFRLPVRLGLVNAKGKQDLLVHVLAKSRYDVANYENVTIPTNIDVDETAKEKFGAFYAALFDRTLDENAKAVVTEYAWDSGGCDPCPSPPLSMADLTTLGADVATGITERGTVLTRLHARYDKESLSEDLVFRKAKPIAGGREFRTDGQLERGAKPASINNFQARYAIRHAWRGRIACKEPQRGVWGGPPKNENRVGDPQPALDLAFAPRGGVKLASFVRSDVTELGIKAKKPAPRPSEPPVPTTTTTPPGADSCSCDVVGAESSPSAWLFGLAAVLLRRSRRERRRSGRRVRRAKR